MKQSPIRYIIAAILMVGALYLAFHNLNFSDLVVQIEHANLWYILIGVLFQFAAHAIRTWRWQIMLRPLKAKTSFPSAFRALLAGYAMNNVVPRLGEVVRPVLFAKKERLPLAGVLATIVIERITDLIALAVLVVISLALFKAQLDQAFPTLSAATTPVLVIMMIGLIAGVVVLISEKRTAQLATILARLFPLKFRVKVVEAAKQFSSGLQSVRSSAMIPLVMGTVGIWVCYMISLYAAFFAFPGSGLSALGLSGLVLLQMLSGLAFSIPIPGGTGSYHYLISQSLLLIFRIPLTVGVAYATLTHAANYLIITAVGLTAFLLEGVSLRELQREPAKDQSADMPIAEPAKPIFDRV